MHSVAVQWKGSDIGCSKSRFSLLMAPPPLTYCFVIHKMVRRQCGPRMLRGCGFKWHNILLFEDSNSATYNCKHPVIDTSLTSEMSVYIIVTFQKGYSLWLYTRFWYRSWLYTVISCITYSKITVVNVTLHKAVLSTANTFAV